MDKMKIKTELKGIKKDLDYYMKEYEMSQKEAYEFLHERYYIRMRITQPYVEIDERNKIYEKYKQEIKQ